MLRLLTDQEVVERYGDPAKYLADDGSVSAAWELAILDMFQLPKPLPLAWGGKASRVRCHKLVKRELEGCFKRLAEVGVWETIDDYGGVYNFRRNVNDRKRLSRHAWAIAIDLDTSGTPHPLVIQAFYDIGWYWGGWFSTPDPMHFEKAITF